MPDFGLDASRQNSPSVVQLPTPLPCTVSPPPPSSLLQLLPDLPLRVNLAATAALNIATSTRQATRRNIGLRFGLVLTPSGKIFSGAHSRWFLAYTYAESLRNGSTVSGPLTRINGINIMDNFAFSCLQLSGRPRHPKVCSA
jgi:hypothetical protein